MGRDDYKRSTRTAERLVSEYQPPKREDVRRRVSSGNDDTLFNFLRRIEVSGAEYVSLRCF